ncbi:NAD-aldehyde dehydrogenase [Flagelloscypha sp. PMI_526]|nr:NAD-aldehyde dehydrogenase [Flagelloscypha sp. PMI_526]
MSIQTTLTFNTPEEIDQIHRELRESFASHKTKSIAFRKYQLLQLAYMLKDNTELFEKAYLHDLGRGKYETHLLELIGAIEETVHCFHNVETWAQPDKLPFNPKFAAMKTRIYKEPKGAALIIGAFNYPLFVAVNPMAGAIAAGCTVALKPSEQTPAISSLLAELFPKYLDPSCYKIINGGVPETSKVLALQWDHILYTGSGRVGRIVAAAAGKNLTPVTLELGGKSPVFVDSTCDLPVVAKRLLWGKFVNAGQTCIAPDYVLVIKSFVPTFLEAIKTAYKEMYADPENSISRIVTPQAWTRLDNLLKNSKGDVILGGDKNEEEKYIAPTVISNVGFDDSLMSEELFGPLLPIVPVETVEEGIAYVNAHDHPLALYVFSRDQKVKDQIRENTLSGSILFNEVLLQPVVPGAPFGGVGPSGSGGYHHGKHSFDLFTHLRYSLENPSFMEIAMKARYPPFKDANLKTYMRLNMPSVPKRVSGPDALEKKGWGKWFIVSLVAALAALAMRTVRTRAKL